jgi:hypothetical protein
MYLDLTPVSVGLGYYQSPAQSYCSLLSQIPLQLAHVNIPDVNQIIIFQRSIQFKEVVLYMLNKFLFEETRIIDKYFNNEL